MDRLAGLYLHPHPVEQGGQAEKQIPGVDITSHIQGTVIEAATTLADTFYDPDWNGKVERVELMVNGGQGLASAPEGEPTGGKLSGEGRGPEAGTDAGRWGLITVKG